MSEYCFMRVTCAAQDASHFKKLGFQIVEREGSVLTLEDDEAFRGHRDRWPADILYEGRHTAGDEFNGAQIACDGNALVSMPCGIDGVIVVLEPDGNLRKEDRERWLQFVSVRERVKLSLDALRKQPAPEPTPLDLLSLKQCAAQAACGNQWLAEKLHQAAESWVQGVQSDLPREFTDEEREQLIDAYKDGYFEPLGSIQPQPSNSTDAQHPTND